MDSRVIQALVDDGWCLSGFQFEAHRIWVADRSDAQLVADTIESALYGSICHCRGRFVYVNLDED